MKKALFWFSCLFFALLCFPSCTKQESISFEQANEDPLAYVPGSLWAVVTEPLAVFRESDSYESPALQPARRGDVFAVTGRRISTRQEGTGASATTLTIVWYGFDNGWLESSTLVIYDNEMQAQNAGRKLVEH